MAENHKPPSSRKTTFVHPVVGRPVAWKPSYRAWKPGFWSGFQDALNVYGYFKPRYRFRNPHLADTQALYEDWAAVGADLEQALQKFEHGKELANQGRLFDPARLDQGA